MKQTIMAIMILMSSAAFAEGTVGSFPLILSCRNQGGAKVLKQIHGVEFKNGQLVAFVYQNPQLNNFNKNVVLTVNPQDMTQCSISPNYIGGAQ